MQTQPKLSFRQRFLYLVGIGLSAGALLGLGELPASAQAQSSDPLDVHQSQTSDPFNNRDSGLGGFFDLMHRVQLGTIRSSSEFSRDQQQNLGTAADDFRTRQRQMLQQQGQPTAPEVAPADPAVVPTVPTQIP